MYSIADYPSSLFIPVSPATGDHSRGAPQLELDPRVINTHVDLPHAGPENTEVKVLDTTEAMVSKVWSLP